ncbi:MAG: monothiol glutaredoxin, Grx4 family [Rhodospirillaceae bacterium]|nr:monothiol glutaredoxin, Grx4 family [Rhodospirillaceae bacterium]
MTDLSHEQIQSCIQSDQIVLFMKGTRKQPQCGFSATVIGILDKLTPNYTTINVLEDAKIRDGIKSFSNWPTIPQLYINQEFMGGCDIVKQMFNTGDLHRALGVEVPERISPIIHLSDEAAEMIKEATREQPEMAVHLSIDASWDHQFNLSRSAGHEIVATANGVEILMDLDSAQRANGLKIELTETLQGTGFNINNPNAPPPVYQITPSELKATMDSGEQYYLFDVRDEQEREKSKIVGAIVLNEAAMQTIESVPKDTKLIFYCHSGPRSQGAAEHFRLRGYTNVHNLAGGIDAWSQQVDPTVPRY